MTSRNTVPALFRNVPAENSLFRNASSGNVAGTTAGTVCSGTVPISKPGTASSGTEQPIYSLFCSVPEPGASETTNALSLEEPYVVFPVYKGVLVSENDRLQGSADPFLQQNAVTYHWCQIQGRFCRADEKCCYRLAKKDEEKKA